MTSIQVSNAARKEQERSNRAREEESRRSNKAQEAETNRANLERERLNRSSERRQQISTLNDIWANISGSRAKNDSNKVALAGLIAKLANDPKWYQVSPQVTSDVASIPAFQPTGTIPAVDDTIGAELDLFSGVLSDKDEGHKFATAGYCHFTYLPSIGTSLFSANNSDGVNITAQNVYSFIRSHNSGAKNYERADYMMYLLAVDGPISYYAWMKRLYGLLNYANVYNKYLPRHIINDMNVDYTDLSSNIARLRGYINLFATRINASLAIPSDMPYYTRHQFLNTYMFSDTKSKKHQLYFFTPRKYYIWKIDPNNQATMLDLEDPWAYTGATLLTLDDIVAFGNYMLETLLNEEDVGLMVGDTIKAFGEGALAKVPEVQDGYVVEIGCSDEILDQITNIKFVKKNLMGYMKKTNGEFSVVGYDPIDGTAPTTHTFAFNVYQNTSTQQIYSPSMEYIKLDLTSLPSNANGIWTAAQEGKAVCFSDTEKIVELNFLTDDTTPERVITSTRLAPTCKVKGIHYISGTGGVPVELTAEVAITSCGSEVILEGFTSVLYWDSVANEAKVATYEVYDGLVRYNSTEDNVGAYGTSFTGEANMIADFDYHPCVNIYMSKSSGMQYNATGNYWIRRYAKLWDRNVSTYVAPEVISMMHATAIMGEFNVASLGLTPRASL